MNDFYCIYCGKNCEKKSEEHIIPESIGGNLIIDNVCETCNSNIGSKVDAKFVDSEYMLFLRYNYRDFLPKQYIPNFRVDILLCLENSDEIIPGYINLSENGIDFQTKFQKKYKSNRTTFYIPDTKEGKKAFERIKNSKNKKILNAEWLPLQNLPNKVYLTKKIKIPYTLEVFKMFLGYLAYKFSPDFALEIRFNSVRDFIQGNRSDLLNEYYEIRTGSSTNQIFNANNISHEIGFKNYNGYALFYVKLFDHLLFEINLKNILKIIPVTSDRIYLKKKRHFQKHEIFQIINIT